MDYNYLEEIKDDIYAYYNKEELTKENEGDLYERMFIDDAITGNASGSYTYNTWKAEEYICHNMDLLREAVEEFGGDVGDAVERGAEYCDVTIRCYLLGQALAEVIEEVENEND